MGVICTGFYPFSAVSAHFHFLFRPLLTTMFHVSRKHLWWVLWSWNEPRRIVPARLDWYLWVNGNSDWPVRQLFLLKDTARRAIPNQRSILQELSLEKETLSIWQFPLNECVRRSGARCHSCVHHKRDPRRDDGHGGHIWHRDHKQGYLRQSSLLPCLHLR